MAKIKVTEENQSLVMLAESWGYIARNELCFARTYRTKKARNRHQRIAVRAARQAAHYGIQLLWGVT